MTIFGTQKAISIVLALGVSICLIPPSFAQTKRSYEDRLSQVGAQKLDTAFEGEYVEFRKEHKIPNYIGDEMAKQALKKAKDDTQKTEVVKIVEAEKLLQDTFKAYHEEKVKTELESDLLKTKGVNQDKGTDTHTKEMDERIDIVGDKTANILNTSIQKLSESKLIEERNPSREVYMASGGRAFPKLALEEDKDLLNISQHMVQKVQQELLKVLAHEINQYYHREQGVTAKEEIQSKEQLLAFVKVEDKQNAMQSASSKEKGQTESSLTVNRSGSVGEFQGDVKPPPNAPPGWFPGSGLSPQGSGKKWSPDINSSPPPNAPAGWRPGSGMGGGGTMGRSLGSQDFSPPPNAPAGWYPGSGMGGPSGNNPEGGSGGGSGGGGGNLPVPGSGQGANY